MLFLIIFLVCAIAACSAMFLYSNADAEKVEGVKMTAIIKNLDGKFEVEIIEGEYGISGPCWINTSNETVYADEDNNIIKKSDLKIGDLIEITYNGQVMLSYPPQVVAHKIQKVK